MTPDAAADPLPLPEKKIPSTAGMTTKVVKGSLWTLVGQVVPLFATLVTTPFVIRFLGSESYGVLLLVGLIPNYFTFADFGMGIASTKFGSEEYGKGEKKGEAEVVRTAAAIAFIGSSLVALPLIVFAGMIVSALNVPERLLPEAALALRLTAISFVFAILSNVFNTPQLARLRMDLNAAISATGRVTLAFGTVAILYLGGGIVGAAAFGLAIAIATLLSHLLVSGRLVTGLFDVTFDRAPLAPLLKFGGGLLISGVAGILLVNSEKLMVSKLVSVRALAYYSVAFIFANMATMFSAAMLQSIGPAFAQLNSPERKAAFDALFARGMRWNLICLFPLVMFLFVIARPFFNVWAGEDFGRESTAPFYILLAGLFFNMLAYIPFSTIVAKGRTDIFAKLYWIELVIYVAGCVLLIKWWGILGAAAAWSLRVILDAVAFYWLSKNITEVSFSLGRTILGLLPAVLFLLPPVLLAAFYDNFSPLLFAVLPVCVLIYSLVVWRTLIEDSEREWIVGKLKTYNRF